MAHVADGGRGPDVRAGASLHPREEGRDPVWHRALCQRGEAPLRRRRPAPCFARVLRRRVQHRRHRHLSLDGAARVAPRRPRRVSAREALVRRDRQAARGRQGHGGAAGGMSLEVLSRETRTPSPKTPLLFVHGAYVGAWCWEEHFLDWFAARGHPAHAVSLRGHGASEGRRQLDDFGLADYAEDVAQAAAGLPVAPVLVGHSMGALVVQKFLEKGNAPAAILACPVPAYGLLPSSFTMAWTRPALFAGLNSVANGGRASPEVLREALFGGEIGPERLERC